MTARLTASTLLIALGAWFLASDALRIALTHFWSGFSDLMTYLFA